jgi:Mg-chelatase subunit ChlD
MSPDGNTNQAIGLAWGWQSLTQGDPLNAPAETGGYQYQKVIILLTDGLNTQNRWTSNSAQIDTRQTTLCNNIKNAGITLYTIQVNTGSDPTSTLLRDCATDASKWFVLTQATQIVQVFNQIGTNLSKLHIAK